MGLYARQIHFTSKHTYNLVGNFKHFKTICKINEIEWAKNQFPKVSLTRLCLFHSFSAEIHKICLSDDIPMVLNTYNHDAILCCARMHELRFLGGERLCHPSKI